MFCAQLRLADNTTEVVKVYEVNEVELPKLSAERYRGRPPKLQYYSNIFALDTETSKLTYIVAEGKEHAQGVWIYQWAVSIDNLTYIAGRTVQELIAFLHLLCEYYDRSRRIVIWVHNLAYDISFFLNALYEQFSSVDIFAVDTRKIIKCEIDEFIELRCSWKLTNKSLDAWCKDVSPRHVKQVGEIDYNTLRTPQSALTAEDWEYQLCDVAALVDCLQHELEGETLRSIPMTSTGYVRRELRKAALKDITWLPRYKDMLPNADQYRMLRRAYSGGYTHSNDFERRIHHSVYMVDAASMYPAVMATEKYPMTAFNFIEVDCIEDIDYLAQLENTALVGMIAFTDLELINKKCWNPYISKYKINDSCPNSAIDDDNGKVRAVFGDCIVSFNEIDWKWIRKQYKWRSYRILSVMTAKKERLPDWFLRTLRKWYENKTTLKGAESDEDKRRYMESKQLLNGMYGCCATDIVRDEVEYLANAFEWRKTDKHTPEYIDETLQKMKRKIERVPRKAPFLPYAWGVWCTAYARDRLFTAAETCSTPLYCDTDSVKGIDFDFDALEKFNADIEKKSRACGFVAKDRKGKDHVIGVFESEGVADRFYALRAKCYAYEQDNELHVTVAGVSNSNGYPKGDARRVTKAEELGALENLTEGKTFVECGGTRAEHIDVPHTITIGDEVIESYGGTAILNTTYQISNLQMALDNII